MVKHTLSLYKRDLKAIFTNYAVLITFIALCILPSLYAWINIRASWDPYSSQATSRIKVAVVNKDKGTALNEKEINVGDEVVKGLRKNTLLGWQFLEEADARSRLEEGEIYAMIVIPESFSSDLTSVITNNIKGPEIRYIVNEKINAIAPKITIKGATGIQNTVGEEVIATVSNIVLTRAKDLGIEVEDIFLPKLVEVERVLTEVEGRFTGVNEVLDETQQGGQRLSEFLVEFKEFIPRLEEILEGTLDMVGTTEEFVGTAQLGINTLAPTIKKDIVLISEISSEIYTYVEGLEELLKSGTEKAPEAISNLLNKVESLEQLNNAILKLLRGLDRLLPNESLDSAISKFETSETEISSIKQNVTAIKEVIDRGDIPESDLFSNIKTLLENANNITTGLSENFDSEIMAKIDTIFEKVNNVLNESNQAVLDVHEALPEVLNLVVKAQEIMVKGDNGLQEIKGVMPALEAKLKTLIEKIDTVNKNQQLKDLLSLIKEDVQERTDFLANTTTIVEETIFPMGNYGSQMAPFYSSLAAWVGLTILVSMISVEVEGEYKSHEVYFAKLLTYLTITIIQGLVIALGDLYLLGIYCLNPGLFILGMVYIAITFTFIVYSLVSVFGNVGKVVAIILMIIQVAGSGGTFPVQLTSDFFIAINPYLPFTYAISFLRECIGGVVRTVLIKDIIALGLFIVGSILISIVLKKHINKLLSGFTHKFHEAGL